MRRACRAVAKLEKRRHALHQEPDIVSVIVCSQFSPLELQKGSGEECTYTRYRRRVSQQSFRVTYHRKYTRYASIYSNTRMTFNIVLCTLSEGILLLNRDAIDFLFCLILIHVVTCNTYLAKRSARIVLPGCTDGNHSIVAISDSRHSFDTRRCQNGHQRPATLPMLFSQMLCLKRALKAETHTYVGLNLWSFGAVIMGDPWAALGRLTGDHGQPTGDPLMVPG